MEMSSSRASQCSPRLLMDVNETPIERVTPNGIKTSDKDYEFDTLVYATGSDGVLARSTASIFAAPAGCP